MNHMDKGATIFVIEQGEYSDYRVCGVYSTRENAEKALKQINRAETYSYHGATISEWPLDPNIEKINQGLSVWRVEMQTDGNQANTWQISNEDVSDAPAFHEYTKHGEPFIGASVWAADAVAAIKILNERRTQAIAMGTIRLPVPYVSPLTPEEDEARKAKNKSYVNRIAVDINQL